MGIEPKDLIEQKETASDRVDAKERRLNATVAVTIAIIATFMGVCKVKDDNIVQAMQQTQADKLDHWAYYQARTIRHDVAEATVVQLTLSKQGHTKVEQVAYDEAIAKYQKLAADQLVKRDELKLSAEQDQKNYDALNYRDDQFDLSDALLAIAIALLAVTALTRLWWMYWVSVVPTGFGVLMGLAGLVGWNIHPDLLIKLLS